MSQEDKVAIACKRVQDLADPGPGASRANCWKCGVEVWVSQNSRRRMREFQATVYCNPCAMEITKTEKHAIIGTAGQIAGLNQEMEKTGNQIVPLGVIEDPDEYLRKKLKRDP